MYKEILDALKTKYAGVSDQVLSRIAQKLAKTTATKEEVEPAVEGVTIQQIIDGEADRRATEAQKTAVANYEAKHGLKDGKPTQEPKPDKKGEAPAPTSGDDAVSKTLEAVLEQNKQMMERLAKMETDRLSGERKGKLTAIVAKLPDALRKPYERIAVDALSEEEFATLLGEVSAEIDGLSSTLTQQGVVFSTPAGGGGTNPKVDLTDAQKAAISQREGVGAQKGQPF